MRSKIDDVVPLYFDGESIQNIIAFLRFCKKNIITTPWSATNRWKIQFKGKRLGMIYIGKSPCEPGREGFVENEWYIHIDNGLAAVKMDNLVEIAQRNILPCQRKAIKPCFESNVVAVLGREHKDICPSSGKRFRNPDTETLDCVKRSLEITIKEGKG